MDSLQISKILKKDIITKKIFIDVFARDRLPNQVKWPSALILNTDESNKPGEHWLAIYYDESGVSEFSDSYGFHPDFYNLTSYLKSTSKYFIYNSETLQSLFCKVTKFIIQHYCVLFLLIRSRNYTLNYFLNFFNNDSDKNDDLIKSLIKN